MNYGWTILIWVAIGLYVFWFLDKVDNKPKEREEVRRNKNSLAPKFFPWLKTAFLPF